MAGYFVVIGLFYILGSRLSLFKPVFMMSAAIILLGFLASMRIRGDSRPDPSKRRFFFHRGIGKSLYLNTCSTVRRMDMENAWHRNAVHAFGRTWTV